MSTELYVPTVEDCLRDPTNFSVTFNTLLGPTLSRGEADLSLAISFPEAVQCASAIEAFRQRELEAFRRTNTEE